MTQDMQAAAADLSDRLTRALRRDDDDLWCFRAEIACVRDALDDLAGRPPWKLGDPPRPPEDDR